MIAGNIQMIIVWYWDLRYIFYSSNIRIWPNCRIFWSFSRNGVPTQDFRCLIKICELPVIDFINATSNSSKKRTNKRAMDNNSSISNNLAYFLNARFDHMFVCLSTDNNGCIEGACKSIFNKSYNLYNSVLAIDQVFGCEPYPWMTSTETSPRSSTVSLTLSRKIFNLSYTLCKGSFVSILC